MSVFKFLRHFEISTIFLGVAKLFSFLLTLPLFLFAVQTKAETVKLCQVKVDNLHGLTVAFDWGCCSIFITSTFRFSITPCQRIALPSL